MERNLTKLEVLDCRDASLNVQKAWNSNSRLVNPNACSTPLPVNSLESLSTHCSGPAMTVRHKHNFYKLQVVKAMEGTFDSDMHEDYSL